VAGRVRHVRLDRLSPFAVPMLMEIGKERSPGTAGDAILAEAESELIAEALA
jgi:ATP-dependent Lhr-like helicase